MNRTDRAVSCLLRSSVSAEKGLGTNVWDAALGPQTWDPKASARVTAPARSSNSRAISRDIIGAITDITGTITRGVVESRQARPRYGTAAAAAAADEAGDDFGEYGGAQVTTPWGRIAIGGLVGVAVIGGVVWLISSKQAPAPRAAA